MAMTIENSLLEGEILHAMGHLLCDLEELDDSKRAVENLPGLARVALLNGDLGNARDRTTTFMRFMKSSALEGLNDPCLAFLICGQVLLANNDPTAKRILSKAHAIIQEYAARIKDEKIRKSFLQNNKCQQKIQKFHVNPFDLTNNSIVEEANKRA